MGRCFGTGIKAKDRPLRLMNMALKRFTGALTLSDCKEYWEYHSGLSSCFADLRPFIERLSVQDKKEFSKFTVDQIRAIRTKADVDKVCISDFDYSQLTKIL